MGALKKIGLGLGIAATGIAGLAVGDRYVTRQFVRVEILNDFAAVTASAAHAFYGCVADRAAPPVAASRIAEKYQRWKDDYAPFLPVTFYSGNDSAALRMIFGDEGQHDVRRFMEMAKHIEPCLKAHGVPEDTDPGEIRRTFRVTNGMNFHFDN